MICPREGKIRGSPLFAEKRYIKNCSGTYYPMIKFFDLAQTKTLSFRSA
ncbi:Uncharacterized protein dnm_077860 [Desulfonema magnum]|uniref:Uncharacterized protein n=1 Tax=Desulfonema magnum TaxID=45655 RepID=A0A975BUG2_9BACT|nr:Uncharacterized protein dnm_077860 [Desulfonema magnum]